MRLVIVQICANGDLAAHNRRTKTHQDVAKVFATLQVRLESVVFLETMTGRVSQNSYITSAVHVLRYRSKRRASDVHHERL